MVIIGIIFIIAMIRAANSVMGFSVKAWVWLLAIS